MCAHPSGEMLAIRSDEQSRSAIGAAAACDWLAEMLFSTLAELERDLSRERTKADLMAASAGGRKFPLYPNCVIVTLW